MCTDRSHSWSSSEGRSYRPRSPVAPTRPAIPDSPVSSRPLLLTSFQIVLPSVSVKLGATTPKSRDRFELLLVSPSLVGSPPAVRVMSPLSMKPPLPRVPLGRRRHCC